MTTSLRAALVLVLVGCFTASASALSISSSQFSLGYGFSQLSGAVGSWQTTETSGANTPTAQGGFSFTPVVTGGQFDSAGTSFPGRVHTTGGGYTGVSIAYSTEAGFQAVVTGAYTGPLPLGTNYRLQLNIDEVSIYGVAHPSFVAGNENLSFVETTPGNTGASTSLSLTPTGAYTTAGSYTQLTWDPADFEELGLVSTRTFTLASDDLRGIDGFEIVGTVELIFTGVPEPSTCVLTVLGATVLGAVSRRRERRA